jgi:hypothetical protein
MSLEADCGERLLAVRMLARHTAAGRAARRKARD